MKLTSKILGLLITLTVLMPALAKSNKHCDKNCKEEVVKYVQGGVSAPGNGTRKHPFSSLLEAQNDRCWDVLIVLPSTVALDYGITLKPGQKLIGECNPTRGLLPTQPTITNTHSASNGGNGAVVLGDSTIKNIYFKNTYASAINYDSANDLVVQDVLITGFDHGTDSISGIQGTCTKSGKTFIERTIIRNDNGGYAGVNDTTANLVGIHRELTICKCDFSELSDIGINTGPVGDSTNSSFVVIKDCYFHDFINLAEIGISCGGTGGATQIVLVENSRFYNIGGETSHIVGQPSSTSSLKLKIDSCLFEETSLNGAVAVEVGKRTRDASSEIILENSVSTSLSHFFLSVLALNVTVKNKLCGNTVTGGIFYQTGTSQGSTNMEEMTDIIGNVFIGSTGISVNPGAPYTLLTINLEDNCFSGGNAAGNVGISSLETTGNTNAGNATITAHCNSIIDFATDIQNETHTTINATENWWGGLPCASGSGCVGSQICQKGVCVGPAHVINTGGGTVYVMPSLTASIKCPPCCAR